MMLEPNHGTRLSSHRGMHGMPAHLIAQVPVVNIRRHAANMVTGVDVLDGDGKRPLGEMFGDPLPQKVPYVLMQQVPGVIATLLCRLEKVLTCAFGNYDDGVSPVTQ
jgi:hypothetical protein